MKIDLVHIILPVHIIIFLIIMTSGQHVQKKSREFWKLNIHPKTGMTSDSAKFDDTLYMLALLQTSGNFKIYNK